MIDFNLVLIEYILPLAVVISAAATTSTAVIAWKLYGAVQFHERTLFGEEANAKANGLVPAVEHNRRICNTNRQVLQAAGMVSFDHEDRDYQVREGQ